jgi:hypothetical protein
VCGRCDDGEFTLDSAEVAEEAAVERKEVRQVRPLLSELQVPEWQELAKDRQKWRKMSKSIKIRSIVCFAGIYTRSWVAVCAKIPR